MSRELIQMTGPLYRYLLDVSLREKPIQAQLREETAAIKGANMQISPDEGQFLALLVELLGAKKVLEIGVFTGYSSLAMALALPQDGRLTACDISVPFTDVARRYWSEAGVADKIDLHLRPALNTLDELVATGHAGTFDLAFIDADKESELDYFERCMVLVRTGGLVIIDNVLWDGRVIKPEDNEPDTVAIRHFNEQLRHDERVSISMVAVADGLTLARKR